MSPQVVAFSPESIPMVVLVGDCFIQVVGDLMTFILCSLIYSFSAVVRDVNMKGRGNRWLFFQRTGLLASAARDGEGGADYQLGAARESSCQLQLGLLEST